jgi:hypothetical protein
MNRLVIAAMTTVALAAASAPALGLSRGVSAGAALLLPISFRH